MGTGSRAQKILLVLSIPPSRYCGFRMQIKSVTSYISKQRILQPSNHYRHPYPSTVSPEGIQDGDKRAALSQALRHSSHPRLCTQRELRMRKDTGPRYWRCASKEWCQWAQTFGSSHTYKNAKFINLTNLVFSNSNLLKFQLPGL